MFLLIYYCFNNKLFPTRIKFYADEMETRSKTQDKNVISFLTYLDQYYEQLAIHEKQTIHRDIYAQRAEYVAVKSLKNILAMLDLMKSKNIKLMFGLIHHRNCVYGFTPVQTEKKYEYFNCLYLNRRMSQHAQWMYSHDTMSVSRVVQTVLVDMDHQARWLVSCELSELVDKLKCYVIQHTDNGQLVEIQMTQKNMLVR